MENFINNLTLLMGAQEAGKAADPLSQWTMPLTFGLVFVVFYFLIIRPQNKKQKEAKKMMAALKKGDKVQTIGGLRGVVWQVKEKEDAIVIKTEDDVKLEFVRSAIASVIEQKPASEDEKDSKDSAEVQKK